MITKQKLLNISEHVNAWVMAPFLFISLFMGLFASVGLSQIESLQPETFQLIGGDLWYHIISIYVILVTVLLITWIFSLTKFDKSKNTSVEKSI